MTTENKSKAFFTLNLPRKPKNGHSISIKAKLRKNPTEFRVMLAVNSAADRNSKLEPPMVALEFKTIFTGNEIKVSTNWKTDTGWQQEEVIDSDWIDSKGIVNLTFTFDGSSVLITDKGNSLIASFQLKYELNRINRMQLWGSIKELREICLKYNQKASQKAKFRQTPANKSKPN